MEGAAFDGLRVLIVEDEALVTMLIEDALTDFGCEIVGLAAHLDEAMEKARSLRLDAAILDVNLNGDLTYPVAQALYDRGIPFIFATGYGIAGRPENFGSAPVLTKPFQQGDLKEALATALQGGRP